MLGLVAASLGFSSLPEPVCVCGNFPLYMTENEANSRRTHSRNSSTLLLTLII